MLLCLGNLLDTLFGIVRIVQSFETPP
jgi:hypothetical protein